MRKLWLIIIGCLGICFFPREVEASLLVIKADGQVVLNVLATESSLALEVPQSGQLGVKQVATEGNTAENISLSREDNQISLKIGESRLFDITNWKDKVVEIEERPEVKSIKIELFENKFKIENEGVFALTDLPIVINPTKNKFSVTTSTGEQYVTILPYEAVQAVLRAKVLTRTENNLDLSEEGGLIAYAVHGEKVINLFNFYDLKVPVTAKVSASTGEILFVDQPPWLRVLAVLLS